MDFQPKPDPDQPNDSSFPLPPKPGFIGQKGFTEQDWIHEKYIDVIFILGSNPGTRIPGHRIVLEQSPVLKDLFLYRRNENIVIPNLHVSATIEVFRWMYSGDLVVQDDYLDLLQDIFQVSSLLGLEDHVNFWTVRVVAKKHGRTRVVEYLDNWIRRNFVMLSNGNVWKSLGIDDVKEIVGIVKGRVDKTEILIHIVNWRRYDMTTRRNLIQELITLLG